MIRTRVRIHDGRPAAERIAQLEAEVSALRAEVFRLRDEATRARDLYLTERSWPLMTEDAR